MNDQHSKRASSAATPGSACLFVGCVLLAACSGNSDSGSQPGTGGASPSGAGNSSAGNGSGLPGGAANAAGGPSAASGSAGAGGGNGAPSQAGQAGFPVGASGSGPATQVAITPHAVPVSAGKAYNMAEDFFDDGFVPPSPLANFGFQTPIIPFVRADGSLDVAWLDYTNGKGKPFALPAPGMIYITHIDPTFATSTTVATGISSYRLLGFTVDPSGAYYLAYCVDHPFKTGATDGDQNDVDGNELKVAKSTSPDFATKVWDNSVFGDKDNTVELSKGNAGAAGSGVLGFDTMNQRLVLYIAHQMRWDDGVRHQAGYFGYFDPATGVQAKAGGNSTSQTGAGWFYSHNFDQRLLIDQGVAYTLAHGDAYDRQLGFSAWTLDSYTKKNSTTFDAVYFAIAGNEGDNKTDTETGQLTRLSDGRFAIIHTTSQGGRSARDVRIVLANGSTGAILSEAWLTTNTGNTQATVPKVEVLGDTLFVSYGLWDATQRTNKKIDWYSLLVDLTLKPLSAAKLATGVEFVTSSPLFRFPAGPYAGSVGWVSGNAMHTLSVNVASSAP